jgi:hypothetical protein
LVSAKSNEWEDLSVAFTRLAIEKKDMRLLKNLDVIKKKPFTRQFRQTSDEIVRFVVEASYRM